MKPKIDPARSAQMALVKSKGTAPEIRVRGIVDHLRFKYLTNQMLFGAKPDLTFIRRKKAIFVHGCFWHQHPKVSCWRSRVPKTRTEFWVPKLAANTNRDKRQLRELRREGWQVLVVWECETAVSKLPALKRRLHRFLSG